MTLVRAFTTTVLAALLTWAVAFSPAQAQFEKTKRAVFIDWPDLSIDPAPMGAEYEILSIVETGKTSAPVIYVISYNYKGRKFMLGAFNCNLRFEILDTSTNGMRDIRCDERLEFGDEVNTTLTGLKNGAYEQQF
jgi:hypothetical protein